MAIKQGKPTVAVSGKTLAAKAAPRPAQPRAAPSSQPGANPQQLMREAAWRRMFGGAETKNPFTR